MFDHSEFAQLEHRWLVIDKELRRHIDDIEVVDKDGWQGAIASLHQKSDSIRTALVQIKAGQAPAPDEAEAHLKIAVEDLELNYRLARGELTAANATTDKDFRAALDPHNINPPSDDELHRDAEMPTNEPRSTTPDRR